MHYLKEAKMFLAQGKPKKVIELLLGNSDYIEKDFINQTILLSGQLQQWNKLFRLGQAPEQSALDRISYALLEIIDLIETQSDFDNSSQILDPKFTCLYDSHNNENQQLTFFNTAGSGTFPNSIRIEKNHKQERIFEINAYGQESVGIEIPINRLSGIVELEYHAISSSVENSENLMFIMIPMKSNSLNQVGYIEVGSNTQDFHLNPFSPYRKRFIIPRKHIGDGNWHKVKLEFDFRYIPDAFYTIFAPRINEGAFIKGDGSLMFKNIKIFG